MPPHKVPDPVVRCLETIQGAMYVYLDTFRVIASLSASPRQEICDAKRDFMALKRARDIIAKEFGAIVEPPEAYGLYGVENVKSSEAKRMILKKWRGGTSLNQIARELAYPPTNLRRLMKSFGVKELPPEETRSKKMGPRLPVADSGSADD